MASGRQNSFLTAIKNSHTSGLTDQQFWFGYQGKRKSYLEGLLRKEMDITIRNLPKKVRLTSKKECLVNIPKFRLGMVLSDTVTDKNIEIRCSKDIVFSQLRLDGQFSLSPVLFN